METLSSMPNSYPTDTLRAIEARHQNALDVQEQDLHKRNHPYGCTDRKCPFCYLNGTHLSMWR